MNEYSPAEALHDVAATRITVGKGVTTAWWYYALHALGMTGMVSCLGMSRLSPRFFVVAWVPSCLLVGTLSFIRKRREGVNLDRARLVAQWRGAPLVVALLEIATIVAAPVISWSYPDLRVALALALVVGTMDFLSLWHLDRAVRRDLATAERPAHASAPGRP